MNILDEIFAYKREEVTAHQRVISLAQMRRDAEQAAPPLDFTAGLRASRSRPALIAEVKCASPSRGVLVEDFDPLRLAETYQQNGASAISVLTDERYFRGHLDYLRGIAQLSPRLPLLRKDFICDPYQIFEARAAGADCVLLIAAYLEAPALRNLHALAHDLGIAALVEVHSREELDAALLCDPQLVGINNRDLRDFTVRLETTLTLRPFVPDGVTLVSESGIHARADAERLAVEGVHAILVGEALVTAPDVAAKVRSFVQ